MFDVDGCLIDSFAGTSLRPLAREILESLVAQGIDVVLWSAGGDEYAERRAREVGIDDLVVACYSKERDEPDGRWRLDGVLASHRAVTFVDDQPGDLPDGLHVIGVSPYLGDSPHDRGLSTVLDLIG